MIEQQGFSSTREQKADQLLRQVFTSPEPLAGDFENRVMSSIQTRTRKSENRVLVLIIMTAYWITASVAGSWLWFEKSGFAQLGNGPGTMVLMIVLSVIGLGVLLLLRQSSFKLSDLFLGTMR